MDYIFIDKKDGIEKVGIVEDDRLVEFYVDFENENKLAGNIYRGRIVNVLPGMEAAFVDIGEGKNAYLYVKNALPKGVKYSRGEISINDVVKNGQEVIVQVIKEPSENKGPKVTTHITLPGRYIVLTPYSNMINISKKILSVEEVERLKEIGYRIQVEDIGMIFRTSSEGIDEELVYEEYTRLIEIYKRIERERNFLPCPKLIYREMDLSNKLIRDCFGKRVEKVLVNNKEKYNSILDFTDMISPYLKDRLVYDKDFDMRYDQNIMKGLKSALDRKVYLKSGGYIVIDETEALTAIDVNTGKFIGNKDLEDTVVTTNLEACEEIARQIRLRDIGGIIIIDFIDMKNDDDVVLVMNRLDECLKLDRNRANVIGITKLGLVEITRKKIRNSLSRNFAKECPYCNGKGKILDSFIDKMSIF
ncbi:MAG TPA: Rne/Rng family ribonuclease [Tissierellia bacterium]|nr:Rne/Rng family ribonuclease [Tissierellia bacterium]